MTPEGLKRFISKVHIDLESACWPWTGSKITNGYAAFRDSGKAILGHRAAYKHWRGSIPEGLCLDHLCRMRHCVNPWHLEAVTVGENVRRGLSITNLRKLQTHCKNGHELTEENTYRHKANPKYRSCKRCWAIDSKRYREKKKLEKEIERALTTPDSMV